MPKDITLGILYSGQLETQLIKSAKKIGGIKTVVLTNDNDGPAKHVADEFICADLNDKNVFYDLIEKAVYKTLLLKFSLNIDNLNKEKIKSTLRVKGIDEKNISKIIQLIENCENAKYSRSSNSIMNNDLNTAKEIINLIQKNK